MKTKDLRELTIDELGRRRRELREEMHNLRLQQATEQLENSARIRLVRRESARVETLLTERRAKLAATSKAGA